MLLKRHGEILRFRVVIFDKKSIKTSELIRFKRKQLIKLLFYFSLQGPPPQGPLKFTIADTLERIKEEFNFLQAQYHS